MKRSLFRRSLGDQQRLLGLDSCFILQHAILQDPDAEQLCLDGPEPFCHHGAFDRAKAPTQDQASQWHTGEHFRDVHSLCMPNFLHCFICVPVFVMSHHMSLAVTISADDRARFDRNVCLLQFVNCCFRISMSVMGCDNCTLNLRRIAVHAELVEAHESSFKQTAGAVDTRPAKKAGWVWCPRQGSKW